MANELLDKIPDWLKSLHHMETELRSAARQGLVLRRDEALQHLSEARHHLEQAVREAKGDKSIDDQQKQVPKDGQP